jgi:lipopolysaccharide/colanic/teichoic acid biosynthesis glycosyltransferase
MESTMASAANKKVTDSARVRLSASFADVGNEERTSVVQNKTTEESGQTTSAGSCGFPVWKRVLDICFVLLGMPLWLPVCLFIAIAIRCGSKGPIFFRQQRIGRGGRIFVCFKFRTMYLDACQSAHRQHVKDLIRGAIPMVKLDSENDSRLIPGGAWIRASGLDELPQLVNVLRGEMSIVGPRPCIPYEYEMYESWQRKRCDAPPGLTGLWQVSGKNHTTFDEMVRLDIEYSKRMSPWLDLWIVIRTPITIVQQVVEMRLAKRARRKLAAKGN